MGWSLGESDGRRVGYSVEATCDREGCEEVINRGVSYACGGDHGCGPDTCGGYFCSDHRDSILEWHDEESADKGHECEAPYAGREISIEYVEVGS